MKLVIQRVLNANVEVKGKTVGKINNGFVILLGVANNDTKASVDYLVKKVISLRVFKDDKDKMNLSLKDVNGELLIISQFTLLGDCLHGNRPSFTNAATPELADELYKYFISECKKLGFKVEHGIFGEHMKVNLSNDGPVTIVLEK